MTDTSEGSISFVAGTTFGVTPATPAFKSMRMTSETLSGTFDTLVSNEIRADAEVREVRRSGLSGSGDIAWELHRNANFEEILAAALRGTWAGDVLKAATQRPHFTFERKIESGVVDQYMRFEGARVAGISMNIVPEEFITGTTRIMAAGHTATPAIVTGATYPAVSGVDGPPMTGVDVSSLAVGGITGVDYLGVTLELDNNLRMQRKIGAQAARGIGYGRRIVTGTLRSYFENLDAYNALLADQTASIVATATDGDAGFTFTIPRVRWTGGEVPNPGNDQDFILTLNWQATFDPTLNTSIQIVRTV